MRRAIEWVDEAYRTERRLLPSDLLDLVRRARDEAIEHAELVIFQLRPHPGSVPIEEAAAAIRALKKENA